MVSSSSGRGRGASGGGAKINLSPARGDNDIKELSVTGKPELPQDMPTETVRMLFEVMLTNYVTQSPSAQP